MWQIALLLNNLYQLSISISSYSTKLFDRYFIISEQIEKQL